MINLAKLIILFVAATVCHWAFASLFAQWGLSVNIMIVFVTAFCTYFKPTLAYSVVFLCGLFLDFFSTKLFGNNAFTFTLFACFICNLVDRFDLDEIFPQVVVVFFLTWLAGLVNTLLVAVFSASNIWPGFWSLMGGAVIDGLFAPFVFWFVRKVLGNSSLCRQG